MTTARHDDPTMRAAFALTPGLQTRFFNDDDLARLRRLVDIDPSQAVTSLDSDDDAWSPDIEVLITGWGAPRIDAAALDRMPSLRAVVHAAGSVKGHVDPAVWQRGIVVTTAAEANAVPVAEFTLAQVLLAGKRAAPLAREYARRGGHLDLVTEHPGIGNHGGVVGVVGASAIGRHLIELLCPFDLHVVVHDPYLSADDAIRLGVESVPLAHLLLRSDVVTLHAPDLPSTRHMFAAPQFAAMRDGSTFINTARQGLVDHEALLAELRTGRINAVLDVTEPEPLPAGHEFFTLPNVVVTPHLAGAQGNELHRLGASAVDEVARVVDGRPPRHPVTLERLASMA